MHDDHSSSHWPDRWALLPWGVIALLTLGLAIGFAAATPLPLDDHFHYQQFIETLSAGRLDLSIPGFHGADLLAVPWYVLTRSPVAQIHFQIFCALLLPFTAFLAGRTVFRRDSEALLFAGIIAMMPFLSFVALRGWTGSSLFVLLFLAISLAHRSPKVSGIILAFAILTKPFAVAMLPLLIALDATETRGWRRYQGVLLALAIPGVYVLLQVLQVGHVIVGSHANIDQWNLWQGPLRIALNAAHALQILFSVHNYYFPNPALTGPGNLMHTTPLLVFLGLFALFSPSDAIRVPYRRSLLAGALMGIGLNVLLDHMDHFYMEVGILFLIIAAVPVLVRFPLWMPPVLATLHFQWFYFFLQFRDPFKLSFGFFAVPAIIDVLFSLSCALRWREVWKHLAAVWFHPSPP